MGSLHSTHVTAVPTNERDLIKHLYVFLHTHTHTQMLMHPDRFSDGSVGVGGRGRWVCGRSLCCRGPRGVAKFTSSSALSCKFKIVTSSSCSKCSEKHDNLRYTSCEFAEFIFLLKRQSDPQLIPISICDTFPLQFLI